MLLYVQRRYRRIDPFRKVGGIGGIQTLIVAANNDREISVFIFIVAGRNKVMHFAGHIGVFLIGVENQLHRPGLKCQVHGLNAATQFKVPDHLFQPGDFRRQRFVD